jgi:hypothetical protein
VCSLVSRVRVQELVIIRLFNFVGSHCPIFLFCSIKVPLIVLRRLGGCFSGVCFVSPWIGGVKPFLSALFSVDNFGEKSDVCAKATKSLCCLDMTDLYAA